MTEDTLFWTLVAVTIAIAGWGLTQVLIGLIRPESDRLEERLFGDLRKDVGGHGGRPGIQKQARDLPILLAGMSPLQRFDRHLQEAFPGVAMARFLSLVVLATATAGVLGTFLHSVVGGVVAGAVGAAAPFVVVSIKRARRQRTLADQLIDALDFLSRVLRAGHSLSTGFQMMGDELPEPIATEFRRCYAQHSLGQPLEQAMLEMAESVDCTDFSFFVTSVLIQRQTGGDLSELLDNISEVVRKRIRLQQHVKALTAEGRASGYILTAMPPVVLMLLYLRSPSYEGVLLYTHGGRMLLLGMACLQLVGLAIIKRIVTVKV
ncbi:MAG: type II secretion system F family protein [Bacillota bacterium]